MINFEQLPALARAMFSLCALLLCLTNLGSLVLAAVKKHTRFIVAAIGLFAPSYFLWQVIFDFSLFGRSSKTAHISRVLCAYPGALWLCIFILLAVGTA